MARMHSGAHGKAGSHRPLGRPKPEWVKLKDKEIEAIVVKLAKEGKSASQIGATLRDTYGIPDVKAQTGKRVRDILREKDAAPELPEDLIALIRKAVLIRKHLESNHLDQPAKRGLTLTEAKIMRLSKYYKQTGKIAANWNYNPKEAGYFAE